MNSSESLHIDVKKVVENKAPKVAHKIPNFVFRFLSHLICQEKINALLDRNTDLQGVDFAAGILQDMHVEVEMQGAEKIPQNGQFIFASNHPLGGLDGMALIKLFGDRFNKKVLFLVNDLLMNLTPLAPVFVPINKHGSQDKGNASLLNDAFMSDNQILIFPAGICSRLQKRQIRDLEWKKAVISKSIEYQRDIIPVYFEGKNSLFFYTFAYLRKKFGIKFNLEMLLLPSEMFKNNNKKFVVKIGDPISWKTFDKSKTPKQWAQYLKTKVYDLQQQ